jgi:CHASE3 domain sensor protein
MQLPIFWRLLLGYSAILLLSVALSAYSIVQLGGLSSTARTALETDTRTIDRVDLLSDAFLSEVRYAGRFVITHSHELHDQYRQFNSDFRRYLSELQALSTSTEIHTRLSRIADLHLRYNDLFDQEVKYIQTGQPYGESRYRQEKEKVLESALRELERFKTYSQKNLQTKLKNMERAARDGRALAIATTLSLVGLGFALCYRISKSITTPLRELQRNTLGETGRYTPPYSRIPEIQNLFESLHQARDDLRVTHASNVALVHNISAEFATPLISLKTRLNHLQGTLGEAATADQQAIFVVLAEETDRLIQGCTRLRMPSPPEIMHRSRVDLQLPSATATSPSFLRRALSLLSAPVSAMFNCRYRRLRKGE